MAAKEKNIEVCPTKEKECEIEDRLLSKAKRIDNGDWVIGFVVRYGFTGKEKYYIVPQYASDLYGIEIDPATICQCTGLKDKNKILIFEKDIIKCGSVQVVVWSKKYASWKLEKEGWVYSHYFGEACSPEDVEVIGNLIDNPELCKAKR